jgi:hypothetical protein
MSLANQPLDRSGMNPIRPSESASAGRSAPSRWADQVKLQVVEQSIILSMRADPEPDDLVTLQEPEGAVSQGHADRVNRFANVDLLKLQARMLGVLAKEPIRFPSRFLNLSWQVAIRRPEASRRAGCHSLSGSSSVALPAPRSARASAASLLKASCESENWRAQCSSSRSSRSSHWAMRSCSSGESAASFATTASSARVMTRVYRLRRGGPTSRLSGPA